MLLLHVSPKTETLALTELTSEKLEFVRYYHEPRTPITSH